MSTRWSILIASLVLSLFLIGCPTTADDDSADDDAGDDDAADDDAGDDDTEGACDDASAMREDALTNGTQILGGVTLEESIAIADILADLPGYNDQVLQIEGWVVELCSTAGCWANVDDGAGNILTAKVDDGAIDWREWTETGRYLVADGVFHQSGEHGAELFVQDHGAMTGTILCP